MKKIILILLILFSIKSFSQTKDSNFQMQLFEIENGFELDSQSKSADVVAGNTYEFIITLYNDYDYKLYFLASSNLNKKVNFEIVDMNTNEQVIFENSENILDDIYVENTYKHNSLDFSPSYTTTLKVIVEVPVIATQGMVIFVDDINSYSLDFKGCVSIILTKKSK